MRTIEDRNSCSYGIYYKTLFHRQIYDMQSVFGPSSIVTLFIALIITLSGSFHFYQLDTPSHTTQNSFTRELNQLTNNRYLRTYPQDRSHLSQILLNDYQYIIYDSPAAQDQAFLMT